MLQILSEAGSTARWGEMDFLVDRANSSGLGDVVALPNGSHALWDRGRLRRMVVMVWDAWVAR